MPSWPMESSFLYKMISVSKEIIHTRSSVFALKGNPHSKVHGAVMGPIWGRQGPGGPHVGPLNLLSGKLHLVKTGHINGFLSTTTIQSHLFRLKFI